MEELTDVSQVDADEVNNEETEVLVTPEEIQQSEITEIPMDTSESQKSILKFSEFN